MKPFQGIHAQCPDSYQQAILLENSTFSRNIYRSGSVDYVLFDEAYILSEDTRHTLYDKAMIPACRYQAGSRIHLEQLVDALTANKHGDYEKAIALLTFVRDIPVNYGNVDGDPFHGGTEEEVIRKGSSMCNEQARVLCVLAQIAGIPARYVGHMTAFDFDNPKSGSGHGVNELFIDGNWVYMDIRGIVFNKKDHGLASTWDLITNPELIDMQQADLAALRKSNYTLDNSRKYFGPNSIHIIANYNVAEHYRYDYSWVYPSPSLWREARERARQIRTTAHAALMPQPLARFGSGNST